MVRGDGARGVARYVVAAGAAGFGDVLFAAQLARVVGALVGCCSRRRSVRSSPALGGGELAGQAVVSGAELDNSMVLRAAEIRHPSFRISHRGGHHRRNELRCYSYTASSCREDCRCGWGRTRA